MDNGEPVCRIVVGVRMDSTHQVRRVMLNPE